MSRFEYYSHSKVKTWRRCHKLFDYKYEQGLVRKTSPAALLRGTTLHDMLDCRVKGTDPLAPLAAYKKIYDELWDEERSKYPAPDDLASIYRRYLEKYQDDGLKYQPELSEVKVTAEKDGIQFLGIIDKVPEDRDGRTWAMDHKCLDSNHWVETNQGKLRMGDLTESHQVISSQGEFVGIQEVAHQSLPGFEIKLTGGKVFRATAEHRWPAMVGNRPDRLKYQIVDTQNLLSYPVAYLVPAPPLDGLPFSTELTIDPYVLGVILGDGSVTQGVRVCCPEEEIIHEVTSRLPPGALAKLISPPGKADSYYLSGLRAHVKRYNLAGKRSYEKHIPENYFRASLSQRMDLLQGLMDTDGSVYKRSSYLYTTTSEQLVVDIVRLITGLGGIPLVRSPKSNKYQGGKVGRRAYLVKFTLPEGTGVPFKLTRKVESIKPPKRHFGSNLKVMSVTPLGNIPVTDITVDSEDHLFSVEGVLTHNTHKVIPDEDKRFSDLQTVLYYWALNQNGTHTDGVLWDYLRTKPPTVPELLKKGGLTRRKDLDSDYETYLKAIIDNGLDPQDYQVELERLKGNVFFKRVYLPNPHKDLVANVVDDFFETAREIENSTAKDRNSGFDCTNCSFFNLCQAEFRGLDGSFIKKQMFTVREPDPLK